MRNISFMLLLGVAPGAFAQVDPANSRILAFVDEIAGKYRELYIDLHRNPELSLMEFNTAAKMADNLEALGFEVTRGVGGNGVVGVFHNGQGKVIMLRTDMDALPVKETTGLPYASQAVFTDDSGTGVPVMHACGHDMHMTIWLGTLSTLVELKEQWKGTIIAVAQPAEEIVAGAMDMINDGLFTRFPLPDYAFSYHVSANMPAGTIGYYAGPVFAGARSVDMTIYGSGGHGAMPHNTIDPVVLASRIILNLQTIVSREIDPVKPAVVTVGSIHGGTKHNIIPSEVKLQMTVRFFEDDIYDQIVEAIMRISRGIAISAGLNEDQMPVVTFGGELTPPVDNNPELVFRSVKSMQGILGEKHVVQVDPIMGAEDFGRYGRTGEEIPVALFWVGGVNHDLYHDHLEKGAFLPPLHNSAFAPDFEFTFRGGVAAMSKTIIDILNENTHPLE